MAMARLLARLFLVVVILLLLLGVDAAKRGRGRARPPIRPISTNHANVEVSTSIAALVDIPPDRRDTSKALRRAQRVTPDPLSC